MIVRTATANDGAIAQVLCNAGEKAVGGGASTSDADVQIENSQPLEAANDPAEAGDIPVGWRANHSDNGGTDTTTVYVICVS